MIDLPTQIDSNPMFILGVDKGGLVLVPVGGNLSGGGKTEGIGIVVAAVPANTPNVNLATFLASPGAIGATAPAAVKSTNFQAVFTDISGAPGNGTVAGANSGRAAFAAAGATVVVTATLCSATSRVRANLEGAFDATLTTITVTPGAGSFTVTGNAAATATTKFSFDIFN